MFLVELRTGVHVLRRASHCQAAKFTVLIQNLLKVCRDKNQLLWLLKAQYVIY